MSITRSRILPFGLIHYSSAKNIIFTYLLLLTINNTCNAADTTVSELTTQIKPALQGHLVVPFTADTLEIPSESQKVFIINVFFNQFNNDADKNVWGINEYWATPMELITKGAGDCEDIAVAKYFFLRRFGIGEDKLRLAYVKVLNAGKTRIEDHIVLLYLDPISNQTLVLDNLVNTISPLNSRNDLIYQYSFNRNGVWSQNNTANMKKIVSSGILKSWHNMLARM